MSQAILISDNEIINSLYEVNLRAYVATNVTIKDSFESAMRLLEESPNIDVVICFRTLDQESNDVAQFRGLLNEKKLKTPIILLGGQNSDIENAIVVPNRYDLKSLLQAVAKILQITAKDMAALEVPEYFPVPLRLFNQMKKTDCDIFYRNELEDFKYEYFKIIEKDSEIEDGVLKKYIDEGVDHLYIDASQRLHFITLASSEIVGELSRDDISVPEKLEIISQGMGVVAEEAFANDMISENMAKISKACINSIEKTIKDVPKLKRILMMLLENQADYCYKHSVISTFVATQILKNISWGSEEQAKKIAFSFFFHDIYLVPVYKKYPDALNEEDLLFNDDVEDEDKQIVLDHAKKAGQLVKTFPKCPMGADMIVTQHHGMTSGEGFAVNYKDDISPLSKIMIISEEVASNIIMTSKDSSKKIVINKKVILEHLYEKYKNHTYKKVIKCIEEIDL